MKIKLNQAYKLKMKDVKFIKKKYTIFAYITQCCSAISALRTTLNILIMFLFLKKIKFSIELSCSKMLLMILALCFSKKKVMIKVSSIRV